MTDEGDLGGRRRLGATDADDADDADASVASFGAQGADEHDFELPDLVGPLDVPSDARGCSQLLHVDPIGGAAGDMLLAAMLDLGVDEGAIATALASVAVSGYRIEVGTRTRHAIVARGVDVVVDDPQPARDYATIVKLLAASALSPRTRQLAGLAFLRLAMAEAKVHRQPLASVHFHEVGGVDAIVDVVGVCAALAWLEARAGGVGRLGVSMSPIPLGTGSARGAHGSIPIPAPATLELLVGMPVRDANFAEGVRGEMVTPTGAALLRAMREALPSPARGWPSFTPTAIGYGAGRRDFADRPNVVRLTLGDARAPTGLAESAEPTLAQLETNLDDATPEVIACALEALMAAGALDAWTQAITMKKGRPATMLCALVLARDAESTARRLLEQTTSLGVRWTPANRLERPRRHVHVETAYGRVGVKIADGDGLTRVVHPELEDCRARAAAHGVPVREVIRAAIVAVG